MPLEGHWGLGSQKARDSLHRTHHMKGLSKTAQGGHVTRRLWVPLDCRTEGIERLTIVDRDTEKVICRIENTVSGRPIERDDVDPANLIAAAPELLEALQSLLAHPLLEFLEDPEGAAARTAIAKATNQPVTI